MTYPEEKTARRCVQVRAFTKHLAGAAMSNPEKARLREGVMEVLGRMPPSLACAVLGGISRKELLSRVARGMPRRPDGLYDLSAILAWREERNEAPALQSDLAYLDVLLSLDTDLAGGESDYPIGRAARVPPTAAGSASGHAS